MSRNNKKSTIKGLPPVLKLQEKDSLEIASLKEFYFSSQGLLNSTKYFFDDTSTINFEYQSSSFVYGTGLPKVGSYLKYFTNDYTGSLSGSGFVVKGIGDLLVSYSGSMYDSKFVDFGNYASDNKGIVNNQFYSSGSSDGNVNYDEPLWAKQSFTIDLTPNVTAMEATGSFYLGNPIAYLNDNIRQSTTTIYWNDFRKTWEDVGNSYFSFKEQTEGTSQNSITEYVSYNNGDKKRRIFTTPGLFYEEATSSFGLANRKNIGTLIENYGFPNDNYTDTALVSYVRQAGWQASEESKIPMSNYITKPFLAQKIIFEFDGLLSCSYFEVPSASGIFKETSVSCLTFMIMNQMKNYSIFGQDIKLFGTKYQDIAAVTGSGNFIFQNFFGGSTYQNTTKNEVVGYFNILGTNNQEDKNIIYNSYNFNSASWDTLNLSMSLKLSGNLGFPSQIEGSSTGYIMAYSRSLTYMFAETSCKSRDIFYSSRRPKAMANTNLLTSSTISGLPFVFKATVNSYENSSYLLMPDDNLVFAFGLPYPIDPIALRPQQVLFAPKNRYPSKITFYGSYVEQDKEENILNYTNLASVSVHGVIK